MFSRTLVLFWVPGARCHAGDMSAGGNAIIGPDADRGVGGNSRDRAR